MSTNKSETVTVESLNSEISTWVEQDRDNPGAWSMFVLHTLKKMQRDYNVTMEYLAQVTKEQFDFVCEAIEEVVYHFQRIEMVDLIEARYREFYGEEYGTVLYIESISALRGCIKNA